MNEDHHNHHIEILADLVRSKRDIGEGVKESIVRGIHTDIVSPFGVSQKIPVEEARVYSSRLVRDFQPTEQHCSRRESHESKVLIVWDSAPHISFCEQGYLLIERRLSFTQRRHLDIVKKMWMP
jgi:hypothetical protein